MYQETEFHRILLNILDMSVNNFFCYQHKFGTHTKNSPCNKNYLLNKRIVFLISVVLFYMHTFINQTMMKLKRTLINWEKPKLFNKNVCVYHGAYNDNFFNFNLKIKLKEKCYVH